jgi:membrane protein YdbS with pleckstrin-like domain
MYCHRCGKSLPPESLFCNACGANVRADNPSGAAALAAIQPPGASLAAGEAGSVSRMYQNEQAIFRIRPAFYEVAVAYAVAVLLSLGTAAGIAYFEGPLWAVFAAAAVFLLFPFYRHIQRNRVTYTLTTAKIEIEYGILSKTIRNIPLRNIQDITTSATIGERLLGVGDVIIDSASEAGRITMTNIRDPRRHADLILSRLHRED